MRLLDEDQDHGHEGGRGRGIALSLVLLALFAGAAAIWWLSGGEPAAPGEVPSAITAPSPAETAADVKAPGAAGSPAPAPRAGGRRTPAPAPREEAPPPAPAPAPELRVDADVEGASVFVDRKFIGTTPVVTRDVTPGTHQLNVSAEGEEGVAQTIEVDPAGPTTISVRLREVRLDARVDVVHKHGVGSCEGRLEATPAGLRYVTSHPKDGFTLPFSSLEVFQIDYLEKRLRVKQRGGRTWNFTTKAETADALFVFHRDVEKARAKLAPR